MDEWEAQVALTTVPRLGSIKIQLLIQFFGSARAVFDADPSELIQVHGISSEIAHSLDQIRIQKKWLRDLEIAEKMGVRVISFQSPEYPKRLLEISDFPIILYVKGQIIPDDQHCLAVVGTRAASPYGMEMAEKISRELAGAGYTIASGLARGVDTAAHLGALKCGRTIAVIGSGLANIYPKENCALSDEVAAKGALISEFPMLTPPDRQNFPQRNRIVSGMSKGVLLIEAPVKSGAMITMEKAKSHKRKLFALPGRVDSERFRGNHFLIKSGLANLVENTNDILSAFETVLTSQKLPLSHKYHLPELDREERGVMQILETEEQSIEELCAKTGLPVMKLNSLLMSLLIKKRVKEFPGKLFKKINM